MTAAERAAWAAAGAAATLAALAGMAVAWGRAVERNEAYGTWQEQPDRYAGMAPVERATARLNDDEAELERMENELNRRRDRQARVELARAQSRHPDRRFVLYDGQVQEVSPDPCERPGGGHGYPPGFIDHGQRCGEHAGMGLPT